jgi:hypothetical protein
VGNVPGADRSDVATADAKPKSVAVNAGDHVPSTNATYGRSDALATRGQWRRPGNRGARTGRRRNDPATIRRAVDATNERDHSIIGSRTCHIATGES